MTTWTDRRDSRQRPQDRRDSGSFSTSASGSVTVKQRAQQVWHRLSDSRQLGEWLSHVTAIEQRSIDEYVWHFADLPPELGCPIRFSVREPPQHLAWQSTGGPIQITGELRLRSVDYQTKITVRLDYVCTDERLRPALQETFDGLQRDLELDLTRLALKLEEPVCEPS